MNTLLLVNLLVIALFTGCLNAHFAKKRGKDATLWFGLGALFGLLALAILFLLPRGKMVRQPQVPMQKKVVPPRRSDSYLKRWFYVDAEHRQVGPMEFTDLTRVFHEKQIGKQSYLWGEGMSEWKMLGELPELEKELSDLAPVPTKASK